MLNSYYSSHLSHFILQQQQQQQHYLFLSHPRLQLYDTLFKNLKFWAIL